MFVRFVFRFGIVHFAYLSNYIILCSKFVLKGVVVETSQVETIIDQTKKREEISDVASFVHNLEEPIEKEPSGEQLSNKEIEVSTCYFLPCQLAQKIRKKWKYF